MPLSEVHMGLLWVKNKENVIFPKNEDEIRFCPKFVVIFAYLDSSLDRDSSICLKTGTYVRALFRGT